MIRCVNCSLTLFNPAQLCCCVVAATPSQISPAPTTSSVTQTSLTLAWSRPNSNGRPINAYKIIVQTGGSGGFNIFINNTGSTAVNASITGLSPGVQYSFTVAAINSVGIGIASTPSAIISTFGNEPLSVVYLLTYVFVFANCSCGSCVSLACSNNQQRHTDLNDSDLEPA